MKYLYVVLIAGAVITIRLSIYLVRKRRRLAAEASDGEVTPPQSRRSPTEFLQKAVPTSLEGRLGDVGAIAMREIKERVRGRIFRVGTLIILLIVAAAIIIPTIHGSSGPTTQTMGVVGSLSAEAKQLVNVAAAANQDSVKYVPVPSQPAAEAELRSGTLDFALIDGNQILVNQQLGSKHSSADATFVQTVAEYLGVLNTYHSAGLTPAQIKEAIKAPPLNVVPLQGNGQNLTRGASVVGIVLLFVMLQQYCAWILVGVMQEKSSRVVEVLLATVRPLEPLGGKVLGIGLVALGQAALVVGFALVVGDAVGSDLLKGTEPVLILAELLWLVLGYSFYCWVYAAAGSTAERQDQIQTLALPLSIPSLVGYIFSITVAASGNPSLLFKILAYLPPTAPFCMSVLVGLSDVVWWQFLASALITIAATGAMAVFAANIYRRAVLRTGGRVHLRELLARAGR